MGSLYEINSEIKKKYKKSLGFYKDLAFVRYNRKFFKLLSNGHSDYLALFSAFELGVELSMSQALEYKPETSLTMDSFREGASVTLSIQEYYMYLNFLENIILPELKEPPDNSKLIITTHSGGKHLAYYRNGNYEVTMSDGLIHIEESVVIDWIIYEESKFN